MGKFSFGSMNISTMMSGGTVTVNGVTIDVPEGSNVSIVNGKVLVDGKPYESTELKNKKAVNIIINGNVGNIKCNGSVTCHNVTGDIDAGTSVTCGDVTGSVDAGTSVHCKNVGRNVDAGTSIRCESYAGRAR